MPYVAGKLNDSDLSRFRRAASRRDAVYSPAGRSLDFEQAATVLEEFRVVMHDLTRRYDVDHDENWVIDATDGTITYEDD